jgi:cell division transport system permease protein
MRAWLAHHARSLIDVIARLARAPMTNLLNIAIIGVALALPTGLYIGLQSLQSFVATTPAEPQLTIFMKLDATSAQIEETGNRLRRHGGVRGVRYVSREDALSELKRNAGLGDVLAGLEGNPLPAAFVVDARESGAQTLERMQTEFSAFPKVDLVKLDSEWARRLEAIVRLGRTVVIMLASLLGFALVAVTFNTIRLQILTRRDEIEVSRLIGATDSFIRRPFLYYGFVLGFAGGIAGCTMVAGGVIWLNRHLTELSQLYATELRLSHVPTPDMLSIVVFTALLGWLGAWLSVTRHLSTLKPR